MQTEIMTNIDTILESELHKIKISCNMAITTKPISHLYVYYHNYECNMYATLYTTSPVEENHSSGVFLPNVKTWPKQDLNQD